MHEWIKKGGVEKDILIYQTSCKLELVTTVEDFAFFLRKEVQNVVHGNNPEG